MPNENEPMDDPEMINDVLQRQVELVLNAGFGTLMSTTVIDLTGDAPEILRQGAGDSTDLSKLRL